MGICSDLISFHTEWVLFIILLVIWALALEKGASILGSKNGPLGSLESIVSDTPLLFTSFHSQLLEGWGKFQMKCVVMKPSQWLKHMSYFRSFILCHSDEQLLSLYQEEAVGLCFTWAAAFNSSPAIRSTKAWSVCMHLRAGEILVCSLWRKKKVLATNASLQ